MAFGFAAIPALASDNPAAHQHGHADLQIAIENERIDLLLLSPAYNLTGFEHKPRTDEQRQSVQSLESWAAETPLINTRGGACSLTSSATHISWGTMDNDHGHDHGHKHHDKHAQRTAHADVEITQSLNCPGLSEGTRLETSLMPRFPDLEHLNVQWVGPQGQGATRLSPANTQFQLNR
ncbi:MAG: DUF2796 domain-containing protein [Marinobacter sp.]|nr:DUF2796 domain-containing protein [Marinobacter sp.]